jgi:uncharacterized protein
MRELVARSRLPVSAQAVFDWHARPGAFERLVPPWAPVEVLSREGGIQDGGRVSLQVKLGPVPLRWELEHHGYREGVEFRDRQIKGPFGAWEHVHRVQADGPEAAWLEDRISYELPAGALGELFGPALVRDRLAVTFAFRHRQIARDLIRQQRFGAGTRLSIAISGASGMIGRALGAFLGTAGHRVIRLVRGAGRTPAPDEIPWDPDAGRLDPGRLEGVDAVVHLAGENLAAGRWTSERKRRIRESRVRGTSLLASTLASLQRPPRVLISASGVNVYGVQGEEPIDESAPLGTDFLAEVATAWEQAAAPAAAAGIRVAHPRFGAVLDPREGALPRFLTPVRAGVGGRLGNGRQPMSWVALDDVVGALHHALFDSGLQGPFNVTAPTPVTNGDFVRTLAEVLGRPALLPVPAFALRAVFGEEMADAVILGGVRALPARLRAAGFHFQHPELKSALREMLGKNGGPSLRTEGSRDELVLPSG